MTNTKNNVISNEDYELDMKLEKYIKMICKKYDLVYKREYDEFGEYGLEHSFEYTSEKVHEQEYHYDAEQERDGFCQGFACNPCYHKVGELEGDEQAEEDGAEGDNLLEEAVLKSFVCEPAGRYENDDVNPVHDLFFKALYKRLGEDEVVEHGIVGGKHIAAVAGPFQAALVDEGDGFADGYY